MIDQTVLQPNVTMVSQLPFEMKAASQLNKWCTIIDTEGNADIFFKYYCAPLFNLADHEANKPQSLCNKLLKSVADPKQFTINFSDKLTENIFDDKYFPVELLDPTWLANKENISNLRANFSDEFPEEININPNFRLVFLFKGDNIPTLFFEKTMVLKIDPTERAKSRERSQDQLERSRKLREEKQLRRNSDNMYGARNKKVNGILKTERSGLENNNSTEFLLNSARDGYYRLQDQLLSPVEKVSIVSDEARGRSREKPKNEKSKVEEELIREENVKQDDKEVEAKKSAEWNMSEETSERTEEKSKTGEDLASSEDIKQEGRVLEAKEPEAVQEGKGQVIEESEAVVDSALKNEDSLLASERMITQEKSDVMTLEHKRTVSEPQVMELWNKSKQIILEDLPKIKVTQYLTEQKPIKGNLRKGHKKSQSTQIAPQAIKDDIRRFKDAFRNVEYGLEPSSVRVMKKVEVTWEDQTEHNEDYASVYSDTINSKTDNYEISERSFGAFKPSGNNRIDLMKGMRQRTSSSGYSESVDKGSRKDSGAGTEEGKQDYYEYMPEERSNRKLLIHLQSQEVYTQNQISEKQEDPEDDTEFSEEDRTQFRASIDLQVRAKEDERRISRKMREEERKRGERDDDEDEESEEEDYRGTAEEREVSRLLRLEEKIRRKYEVEFGTTIPVITENKKARKQSDKIEMKSKDDTPSSGITDSWKLRKQLEKIEVKSRDDEGDLEEFETMTVSKKSEKRTGNTIMGNQYLEEGKVSIRTSEVQSIIEVDESTPKEQAKKKTKKKKVKSGTKKEEKGDGTTKKSDEPKKVKVKDGSSTARAKSPPKEIRDFETMPNTERGKRPPSVKTDNKTALTKNASTGNLNSPVKSAKTATPGLKSPTSAAKSPIPEASRPKSPSKKREVEKVPELNIPAIKEKGKKSSRKDVSPPVSPTKGGNKVSTGEMSARNKSPAKGSPKGQTEPQNPPNTSRRAKKDSNSVKADSINMKSPESVSPTKKPKKNGEEKLAAEERTPSVGKAVVKKGTKGEGGKAPKKAI